MLGALVIVFREVIEAGLIVGIVLAATRGVAGRGYWIAAGIIGGLCGAGLVAAFAETISDAFAGSGQEMLNAAVLSTAVLMLMWHNAWMARHGRELATSMQSLGAAVKTGERPLTALAIVVGLAVLREGSEVVLFLYGVVASGSSGLSVFAGGMLGVALGVAFTLVTYAGLLVVPTRYIFAVTSTLITLLAAGLAAQAVQFLAAAGLVEALGKRVWDTSRWLPEDSLVGRLLHTLIGYSDQPSELQLIVYVGVILAMIALMRLARPVREKRETTAASRA